MCLVYIINFQTCNRGHQKVFIKYSHIQVSDEYGYASFIKESMQHRWGQPGPTESAQSIQGQINQGLWNIDLK